MKARPVVSRWRALILPGPGRLPLRPGTGRASARLDAGRAQGGAGLAGTRLCRDPGRALSGLGLAGALLLLAWVLLTPAPVDEVTRWPVSPALQDRDGRLFHVRLSEREEYCLPVPLARMGKWLPMAAVAVEDRRFYRHAGLDPLALGRAAFQNWRAGRVVSGASTITSQCVRMAFPGERSLWNKAREFVRAVRLDAALPKDSILEIYLNRAPFGGPVRGAEAAARAYFGKQAAEMSLAEAALLVGMLRGPSVYRPDRNPGPTLERRNRILERLAAQGDISRQDLELALLEPLPGGRRFMPAQARHFADLVLRSLPPGYWRRSPVPVRTTLDSAAQLALEQGLASLLAGFPAPVSAAGGVADPATGEVRAYVGNSRLDVPGSRGWVDCGLAPRSPGSLLKPFVYLTAMEQGRLIPATLLADTPLSFGGDAPRNYDRRYRGPVNAGVALADSLNAPAVRVLRLAGGESALQLMRRAGLTLPGRPAAHYGDSLVLGGCEISLLQVLEAYAGLASLGLRRPLAVLAPVPDAPGPQRAERFASRAGAWLLADSLADRGRLPRAPGETRIVAFKTGTSYGHRDAWAAAYTPETAVAVWVGDPSGDAHPGLSGLGAAAPEAVRLARALSPRGVWFAPPAELERFTACSLSGSPATPACPDTAPARRIASVTATRPCALHFYRNNEPVTRLPVDLEQYIRFGRSEFEQAGQAGITLPRPGAAYYLSPEAPDARLALRAEGVRGTVHWYLDGEFLGRQEPGGSLILRLTPGPHALSLVDSEGRTAVARFTVVNIMEQRPVLKLQ